MVQSCPSSRGVKALFPHDDDRWVCVKEAFHISKIHLVDITTYVDEGGPRNPLYPRI